jgi:hypothetical protein
MGELDLKSVNKALRDWETFYNTVRPHHSLALRTLAEYLDEYTQRWLEFQNRLICPERIQMLDPQITSLLISCRACEITSVASIYQINHETI